MQMIAISTDFLFWKLKNTCNITQLRTFTNIQKYKYKEALTAENTMYNK